jgi:hypothetical protein
MQSRGGDVDTRDMNILAFFLGVLAVICFCHEQFARTPHKSVLPLGLALFASAVVVQLVWHTTHIVVIH